MKLTQEQLAALIAQVFANLIAAGKDPSAITQDDIMAEMTAIIEAAGIGDPAGEGGAPEGDEGKGEGEGEGEGGDPAITPEFITQVLDALKACQKSAGEPSVKPGAGEPTAQKGAEGPSAQKGAAPAPAPAATPAPAASAQRKYSSLFLSTGASRDGGATSGFKTRIQSMSAPERRKTAYGMFGRAVKCIHASGGEVERAAYVAEHKFNDAEMAREFKALAATQPTDGGYLVPEVYADEIIELLYPATVIYDLGARRLAMDHGNLNIPKLKTGTRAMYTGENRKIPKTAPKFGNIRLSSKKLTALIPMSNDLLRSTSFDNDVIVGQDVTKQMALGVDWGAFRGTGGEFQPLGLFNNKAIQNIKAADAGTSYASADGVLTAMFPNFLVASVLKNNVYADALGFVFNTSVEQFFKSMRDQVGGFIFAEEMNKQRTLAGYPYRTTNLIDAEDGKTKIAFGNWNDLIIGEQGALEIETSREGSWTDEAGNLVSAFENDQTLIRAIDNVDVGLRHDESFVVATGVAVPV